MTSSDDSNENLLEIDRGQPVVVTVTFGDGEPDEVNFSYTRPGSDQAFVDDGFGQARSQISRIAPDTYRYTFSTVGFSGGVGHWVFTGEWDRSRSDGYDTAKIRGRYRIREAPSTLI